MKLVSGPSVVPAVKAVYALSMTGQRLPANVIIAGMRPCKPLLMSSILGMLVLSSSNLVADEIRVAVASNFRNAIVEIARLFEANTDHKAILSFGSTGKHYAQIKNGAPFDVFLAADLRRPLLLEQEGDAIAESRFTYAQGQLVLWSPREDFVDAEGRVLEDRSFRHIAIANPDLAPYGKAAFEVLHKLGVWNRLKPKLVRGENINQAFQFVDSGNAELGFVAYSQVLLRRQSVKGSFWLIPQSMYSPIEQQAVLLEDNEAARAFLAFLKSRRALQIVAEYGYETP